MDVTQGFTADTIWTVIGMVVVTYLAGTIARDRFNQDAKLVGLITAAVLSILIMLVQLLPTFAPYITVIVVAFANALIVYTLAWGSSAVLEKLSQLTTQPPLPEPVQDNGPADADDYTYPVHSPAHRLSRW
jgi:hypothetical protein